MKIKKPALRNLAILTLITLAFVACEEEFTTIDSDIINEETATNFNVVSEKFEVLSYTDKLGPVQTNALGLATLGIYIDPFYGRTNGYFLTQLNLPEPDPSFGGNPELDSVVLTIPFFNSTPGVSTAGEVLYDLDSILPRKENNDYPSIRLRIYESNYFLRDFDPNGDFDELQNYFSNKSASSSEVISESVLKGELIHVENELSISNEAINLLDNEGEIIQTLAPSIRIVLDNEFWENKILNEEGGVGLSNADNFRNYFKGLYFEAEDDIGDSSMMLLDISQSEANVTMYYSRDPFTAGLDRVQTTFTLGFGPTRVNFLENEFSIEQGDSVNGDERISLKGGEGSVAGIKLLFNSVEENGTILNFEDFKNSFARYENDEFIESKRLINEANLIFYVDQDLFLGLNPGESQEPDRLYLYNKSDNIPLADYFEDTQNNSLPQISIPNHLGILERDEITNNGVKYKMTITSHINNLLFNNAENVELGLAVSGNVNLEGLVSQYKTQTIDNQDKLIPVSSIITPRGTVLHGGNSEDTSSRIYLQITYTCLETDSNCPNN
ncbi:MAG: DUF4270 domain-containing protein [Winogradskyella sp.]|uniref:DUF4270 domain-containing protein n=1 Tax=Winogradskyella sp. TaxID=1883156 RepID=UPI0017B7B8B0|nr:DUF4270 domain-containing protein [Winogradskyella sp.]MBT8244802.1 DUF4270 domain-containing protein [Winogradskyella sp.]NNK21992.1 DUF4270 domain-containing protein [Winogradskyella sp.]